MACNAVGVRWRCFISAVVVAAFLRVQAAPEPVVEIPFQFREGLIQVRVKVPQSAEPLNFLLDTGASVSVIDLHTAQRLGLKPGKKVHVLGVHSATDGYWPTRLTARSGDFPLPEDYLAVDMQQFSDACEFSVEGLLGVDFFRDRVVQIDFAAETIRLFNRENTTSKGEVLPLEIRRCGMRVQLCVNGGKPQWTRLDTGCASALQWVTSTVRTEKCERRIAIGLNKLSIPQATTTVRIGSIVFEAVPTGLHRKPIFAGESGLLGNGLLARFSSITIDARAGRAVLGVRLPAS
ncbi:MAG TPA: aspartyl protease family protein [Haliangiales bacterium]|nr:aspartyl protease family protein [Haliangiales bacterium]